MELRLLEPEFAIWKARDFAQVDFDSSFLFLAKTDDECSIVCPADELPQNCLAVERSWRAFRIEGQLDFSLVGIIAQISAVLAAKGIGIFVVSTFNTDYILVRNHHLADAMQVLTQNGYPFVEGKRLILE